MVVMHTLLVRNKPLNAHIGCWSFNW